jgi:hypothetical protein
MEPLARLLLTLGGILLLLGLLVLVAGRVGLPLGRLPGDVAWRGKHTAVYFPLGTSILLSIVLSLVFWAIGHLRR